MLDGGKLYIIKQTIRDLFGWRGQFTPVSSRREASMKALTKRKAGGPRLWAQPSQSAARESEKIAAPPAPTMNRRGFGMASHPGDMVPLFA